MFFDSLEFFSTFGISITWIIKLSKAIYWDQEAVTLFDELILTLFLISIFGVFSYQRHFIIFTCFSMVFTTLHALDYCIKQSQLFYKKELISCTEDMLRDDVAKCYYRDLVHVGIAQAFVALSVTASWLCFTRLIRLTPKIKQKKMPLIQVSPLPYDHRHSPMHNNFY